MTLLRVVGDESASAPESQRTQLPQRIQSFYIDGIVMRGCFFWVLLAATCSGCRQQPDANVQSAKECLEGREWDRAIQFLDEAIRETPSSAESYLLRGRAFLEKRELAAAISDLERAVSLGMEQEGSPLLARAYFASGEYLKAQAAASAWIKSDPSANAYLLRGRARLAQSDARGALVDLEQASKLDAQFHQPHFYRGLAHLQLEEFEQAETCLSQSISAESSNPYGFWMRAVARDKLGKSAEAESDRTTAKELDPALRFTKSDGDALLRSAIERDTELVPIELLNSTR
jgi:tetratricopeptide (TPR) repeat protein